MSTGEWVVGGGQLFPASHSNFAVLLRLLPLVWPSHLALRLGWLQLCKQTMLGGEDAACYLSSQQVEWSTALRGASSGTMWRAMSSMTSSTRVLISP